MLIPDHPNGNVYFHRIWPWFVLGALTHRSVFLGQNRLFGIVTLAFITGSLLPFRENLTLPYIVRATTVVCLSLLLFNTSNSKVWIFGKGLSGLANISFPLFLVHMTIVRHSHFVLQFTNPFNVLPIFTYIMIVGMSLLLAIAITPLMNRIDKFLMAKLFVRPAQKV